MRLTGTSGDWETEAVAWRRLGHTPQEGRSAENGLDVTDDSEVIGELYLNSKSAGLVSVHCSKVQCDTDGD